MATHAAGHDTGAHKHNDTPKTFVWGIVAALVTFALTFFIVQVLLMWVFPPQNYDFYMGWIESGIALVASLMAGGALFVYGLFNIGPGQRAYLMLLGVPIEKLSLGAGDGWLLPVFMSVKIEDGRGKTVNPGVQSNTTQNGIEVSSDVAGTYEVLDLLNRDNMIEPSAVEKFVSAELVSAVRGFIAGQKLDIDDAMSHGELSTEQAFEVIKKIAQFRHGVEGNGDTIRAKVNEKIVPYGLRLTSLQIEDVALPKEIEDAAKRVLSETVESAGLTKDARNKAAVAKELLAIFETHGVSLKDLPKDIAADLIDRNLDRAMAAEDKATIKRINFGGSPPRGTLMNTDS